MMRFVILKNSPSIISVKTQLVYLISRVLFCRSDNCFHLSKSFLRYGVVNNDAGYKSDYSFCLQKERITEQVRQCSTTKRNCRAQKNLITILYI